MPQPSISVDDQLYTSIDSGLFLGGLRMTVNNFLPIPPIENWPEAKCVNEALMIREVVGLDSVRISSGSVGAYVPENCAALALNVEGLHLLANIGTTSSHRKLTHIVSQFLERAKGIDPENSDLAGVLFIGNSNCVHPINVAFKTAFKLGLTDSISVARNVSVLEAVGISELGVFHRGNMLDVTLETLRTQLIQRRNQPPGAIG